MMEPTTLHARAGAQDVELLLCSYDWRAGRVMTASDPWHVLSFSLSARPPGSRGRFHVPGEHFDPIGDVLFLPAGVPIIARCDGGSQTLLRCRIDGTRFAALGGKSAGWTLDELRAGLNLSDQQIRTSLGRLAAEVANPGFASARLIEAITTTLVVDLARLLGWGRDRPMRSGGLTAHQLGRIARRIADPDLPPPSVSELAALLSLSSRHLLRGFRQAAGTTLRAALQTASRDRAIDLLTRGEWPIERIARHLGFRSQGSFSTAFRNATGESPLRYRQHRR